MFPQCTGGELLVNYIFAGAFIRATRERLPKFSAQEFRDLVTGCSEKGSEHRGAVSILCVAGDFLQLATMTVRESLRERRVGWGVHELRPNAKVRACDANGDTASPTRGQNHGVLDADSNIARVYFNEQSRAVFPGSASQFCSS
jgi:hypothetical protein